tara:strand:+ start:5665 stop:6165 length:501 start_codon:yes stop_codon:yes gene_type:complete
MAAVTRCVSFKNINDGRVYTYPHINDTLLKYKYYYTLRLSKTLNLTNNFCDISIIYIDDRENGEDIIKKFLNKDNVDIDTLLYQYYHKFKKDNIYFYIKINNNTRNNLYFQGECIVCYNTINTLRNYYNCSNTNSLVDHGLCEECHERIRNTQYNVCPMCRSDPLN